MSKKSTKKLSAIITGLLLIIQIGLVGNFNIPQAQAAQLSELSSCRAVGEMCGGIGGFACCSDLTCILDGDYPDASGTCVLQDTSCLPDNTLIKPPNDPKIYVIIDCKKKWIETIDEFQQGGYNWSDVEEVSSPVIQAYADYLEATANLMRAIGHNQVYRIVNGKRLWVPTISAFNAQGLKWDDIEDVDGTTVEQYPRLALARLAGDPRVYYLTENGLKRHIPSVEAFNSYGNQWTDVVELLADELNAYADVILIRAEGDPKVYKLENNQKRWIKTAEAFNRLGLNWDEIAPVNATETDAYEEGEEIE